MPAHLMADSFVTLASLVGLLIFAADLRQKTPRTYLIKTFIFAIGILCALMAARLLQWVSDWDWPGRVTFLFAGLVPLAALLVVEALLRKHAPLGFKLWAAIGAFLFALIALFVGAEFTKLAIASLALFQIVSFIGCAGLVLLRDKSALTLAENQTINRLALSFLLILPFLLTDFRNDIFDAPVRLAGVAILALCWLALTVEWDKTLRKLLFPFVAYGACLLIAAVTIGAITGSNARSMVQILAILVSSVLLVAIYRRTRSARTSGPRSHLLSTIARAQFSTHREFVAALSKNAPTGDSIILKDEVLGDFDAAFRAQFRKEPLMTAAMVTEIATPELQEQFSWFFRKYDASHAVLLSDAPFCLLVLNIPELAQPDRLDTELRVVQRLSAVLARQELQHD